MSDLGRTLFNNNYELGKHLMNLGRENREAYSAYRPDFLAKMRDKHGVDLTDPEALGRHVMKEGWHPEVKIVGSLEETIEGRPREQIERDMLQGGSATTMGTLIREPEKDVGEAIHEGLPRKAASAVGEVASGAAEMVGEATTAPIDLLSALKDFGEVGMNRALQSEEAQNREYQALKADPTKLIEEKEPGTIRELTGLPSLGELLNSPAHRRRKELEALIGREGVGFEGPVRKGQQPPQDPQADRARQLKQEAYRKAFYPVSYKDPDKTEEDWEDLERVAPAWEEAEYPLTKAGMQQNMFRALATLAPGQLLKKAGKAGKVASLLDPTEAFEQTAKAAAKGGLRGAKWGVGKAKGTYPVDFMRRYGQGLQVLEGRPVMAEIATTFASFGTGLPPAWFTDLVRRKDEYIPHSDPTRYMGKDQLGELGITKKFGKEAWTFNDAVVAGRKVGLSGNVPKAEFMQKLSEDVSEIVDTAKKRVSDEFESIMKVLGDRKIPTIGYIQKEGAPSTVAGPQRAEMSLRKNIIEKMKENEDWQLAIEDISAEGKPPVWRARFKEHSTVSDHGPGRRVAIEALNRALNLPPTMLFRALWADRRRLDDDMNNLAPEGQEQARAIISQLRDELQDHLLRADKALLNPGEIGYSELMSAYHQNAISFENALHHFKLKQGLTQTGAEGKKAIPNATQKEIMFGLNALHDESNVDGPLANKTWSELIQLGGSAKNSGEHILPLHMGYGSSDFLSSNLSAKGNMMQITRNVGKALSAPLLGAGVGMGVGNIFGGGALGAVIGGLPTLVFLSPQLFTTAMTTFFEKGQLKRLGLTDPTKLKQVKQALTQYSKDLIALNKRTNGQLMAEMKVAGKTFAQTYARAASTVQDEPGMGGDIMSTLAGFVQPVQQESTIVDRR